MNERRKDKAEVQSEALGVVVSWLRQEAHIDGEGNDPSVHMAWAQEAQERIACFVELEAAKLRMKSTSYQRILNPARLCKRT